MGQSLWTIQERNVKESARYLGRIAQTNILEQDKARHFMAGLVLNPFIFRLEFVSIGTMYW